MANKTALITGVIGGVGSTVARTLLAEGWTVIGSVRAPEQVAEVQAEIPGIADVVPIDLSNADNVEPALGPVLERHGRLDAVVLASGLCPFGPLETTPLSELRNVLEINTVSPTAIYRATIPYIRKSQGHFIIMTSVSGKLAVPVLGHYSASKHALEAIADTIRREGIDWGIKVVVIEPGGMKSRMVDLQMRQVRERKATLSPEEREMYGHLYDGHEYALSDKNKGLGPPEEAAEIIVAALRNPDPETRYTVGKPAAFLCGLSKTKSDREVDTIVVSNKVWEGQGA